MDDDEIPWTLAELVKIDDLLNEQSGIQPVTEALRLLLAPIVKQLIKRKQE
ncbi:MAG TPA: hypothetical protein VE907_06285 [Gammaproteobacteria bacterium]|nr:hypothetical protein [Gammaproteobacteria bacterium]